MGMLMHLFLSIEHLVHKYIAIVLSAIFLMFQTSYSIHRMLQILIYTTL